MDTFSALLGLCEGKPTVSGGFPSQRSVAQSSDAFFDLCLNKRLGNHSRRRWFETPLCSLRIHCNVFRTLEITLLPMKYSMVYLWPQIYRKWLLFDNRFVVGYPLPVAKTEPWTRYFANRIFGLPRTVRAKLSEIAFLFAITFYEIVAYNDFTKLVIPADY